eukprot:6796_1
MASEPSPNANDEPNRSNSTSESSSSSSSCVCKCKEYDTHWKNKYEISILVEYCGCIKAQQLTSNKLFLFRVFAAIYCVCILVWNFTRYIRHNMTIYFFIYITQWDAIMVASYFITICIINVKILRYINTHIHITPSLNIDNITIHPNGVLPAKNTNINVLYAKDSTLRFLCALCSTLFSICFAVTMVITISNWAIATDYSNYIEDNDDIEKLVNDIHLHGVLSVLIGIDYSVSALYLPYNSIVHPFIFTLVFVLWSLLHYTLKFTDPFQHRYIYYMLNWKYPHTAIPMTVILIGCVMAVHQLCAWIKYKYILNKWFMQSKDIENIATIVRTESDAQAQAEKNKALPTEDIYPNNDVEADPSRNANSVNPSLSPSQLEPDIQIELEENKDSLTPHEQETVST